MQNLLNYLIKPKLNNHLPSLLKLDNTLCQPLIPLNSPTLKLQGGLYSQNGQYIPSSGLITNKQTIVGAGQLPPITQAPTLTGKSLYLGICHKHFGHFLIETWSRLWFLKPNEIHSFDHIILLSADGFIADYVHELFNLLGVSDKLKFINTPVYVQHVYLPAPAIEYPKQVHRAVASIQLLFNEIIKESQTDAVIFLSRSQLVPAHHRVIIGEDIIEHILRYEGVTIFYPEKHSITEQIKTLCAYQHIISFAGSALHTLLLTNNQKKIIAYSGRTIPPLFALLDNALNNHAHYMQANYNKLIGRADLNVGFKPQLINVNKVLWLLKQQGIIRYAKVQDYGIEFSKLREIERYNTALLLRWVLEASQQYSELYCHRFIENFKKQYLLNNDLIEQAKLGSALIRIFF